MTNKLWTPAFVLGIVVNLCMSIVFYLLMTSMAGYAIAQFHAAEVVAGLASSGFIVGAVLARIFTGKYLDFIGRRRLLFISMTVFLLAALAYIPVADVWIFIAVRIIHGIAFGAGNTAIMTAIQAVIPPARRAEGTGYFGTATTLSTALGPFLAVVLPRALGFTSVFLVAGGAAVIALLALCFLRLPERTPSPEEIHDKWRLSLGSIVDPVGMRTGTIMLLAGAAYASILVFLAGYTASLSMAEAASAFFVGFAVTSLVSRLTVGRLQDRYGDNAVVYPLLTVFALGMAGVAWAPAAWVVIAAGAVIGVGFGTLLPSLQAITVSGVSPARVPVATSTFFLGLDLGSGVGPVLLGALIPVVGFHGMYWCGTALVGVAALVYFWVHGKTPTKG